MGTAPVDAKYVVGTSNTTLTNEIAIKSFITSADIAGVAGGGTSEEYDTSTEGITWSTTPTTHDSNTTRKSHLYWSHATTAEIFGTKTWQPSAAFDARCKIMVNSLAGGVFSGGLHIQNSDNTSRLLLRLQASTATGSFIAMAFTFASGSYTQRGSSWSVGKNELYLRIVRDGSNNNTFYWSHDGYAWMFIATQALTFTVDKIGFRSTIDNAAQYEIYVDWLRTSV